MTDRNLENISFPGRQEGEIVKELISKHWLVEVPILLKIILTGIIYAAIIWLLYINPFDFPRSLSLIIFGIASLALSGYYLGRMIEWMDQLLDVFVVTNRRLLSFEQIGMFGRITKEMNLRQVEDAQAEQSTFLDNLFQLGHLTVANKSDNIVFTINNIPHPHDAKRYIVDARDRSFSEDKEQEVEEVTRRVGEEIALENANAHALNNDQQYYGSFSSDKEDEINKKIEVPEIEEIDIEKRY
ncbi:MAG: PH domain-containing protein [Patescibacteria group bacterium]|nr:PH domain-containing protein [Patescibacteria group bacterium]